MNKRTLALLAATSAAIIYGINHTIAKGVMPTYVGAYGFIFLRLGGAAILFWMLSFFLPKEKIKKEDWRRLLVCTLFGMGINMLAFFKGLSLSTPINSAVLITTTPIFTVIFSFIIIKEKIYSHKIIGIIIGLAGAIILILFGAEIRQDAPNIPLGNLLYLVNCATFSIYLILVKKMLKKYHPFTLMKWLFTIGTVITLPITYNEVLHIKWSTFPLNITGAIIFVVVGTTFLTYLFNIFALTQLKASTVSSFVYLQPVIGILFSLLVGKDQLTPIKIIAGTLVIIGIYLASKPITTPRSF